VARWSAVAAVAVRPSRKRATSKKSFQNSATRALNRSDKGARRRLLLLLQLQLLLISAPPSLSLSRSLSGSLNRPSPANLHAASLVEARARRVPRRAFFAAAAHVGYRKRRAAPQQREAVGVEGRFARGAVLLARRTREETGRGGR
jgi:hypothetical protein